MEEMIKIAVSTPLQEGGNVITPEQLRTIADAAGPKANIEITPFRQIYMEIPLSDSERIRGELNRSGLEVYPAGAVIKGLIACQFCKGAEDAGLSVAESIHRATAGIETPAPLKIGYAGCALGTSEPLLKDIGVVKMKDTFSVYVGGEPKGIKAALAELLTTGLSEDQVIPIVMKLIDYYKANAKGKEKFSRFVGRISVDTLKKAVLDTTAN